MDVIRKLFPSTQTLAVAGAAVALLVAGLVAIPLSGGGDAGDDAGNGGVSLEVGQPTTPGQPGVGPADVGSGAQAGDGAGGETGTDTGGTGGGGGTSGAGGGGPAGGTGGGGEATVPAGTSGGTGLTASDRGVTPDAIKLGIMILNVGNVERLGVAVGVDPEQQQAAWNAYVAQVNESGGVNGRKIQPVFRQFDVTSNDSQRAACLALTKDSKVFAVLDIALTTANALCVSDENETPLVTLQPMPRQAYDRSEGRLVTLFGEGSRVWRNLANDLHARGALRGRTIGILGDSAPGNPPTLDAFVAELRRLGYQVAHRSVLESDGSTATLPQAASQIPVEVQAMQRKDVDLVFLATGVTTATQFVQTSEGQRFTPKYVATDWMNAYSDTSVGNMPDSFDATLITTNRTGEFRTARPEPETERRCREIYERRTKAKLDRTTIAYNSTVRLCTILEIFTRAARAAGPGLTRPALSAGFQGIGAMPLATFGGGSLREGKFDAADLIRTAAFRGSCNCWVPVDDFRTPTYR